MKPKHLMGHHAQAGGISDSRAVAEFTIDILTCHAAMRVIADDWRALETEPGNGWAIFQSYAWCESWVASHCTGVRGAPCPFVFTARDGAGELLALLPMMREWRGGVRCLTVLGEPHTQMADALCAQGVVGAAALRAILDAIATTPAIDVVLAGPLPVSSRLAAALGADDLTPDPAEHLSIFDCSGLETGDDYIASLSKQRRRDFRRKLAKLEDDGPVTFSRHHAGDAAFAPMLADGLRLKRDWLKATGTISIAFNHKRIDAFFEALAATNPGALHPEVDVLSVGDKPISIALNMTGPNERACYLCAYDPAFHAASPGTLMHQHGIIDCITEGRSTYSLLGYPTPFKAIWTDDTVPLVRYDHAVTLRGHAYLTAWRGFLRPRAKQVANGAKALLVRMRGKG